MCKVMKQRLLFDNNTEAHAILSDEQCNILGPVGYNGAVLAIILPEVVA